MKITQLELTNETALDVLIRDNVYVVRFSEQHGKRPMKTVPSSNPYGISFKNIKSLSVKEIVELVQSKKAALVEVIMEES